MTYAGPSVKAFLERHGANGGYLNRQDGAFRLFPFTTKRTMPEVTAGSYLRRMGGKVVANDRADDDLAERLMEKFGDDVPEEFRGDVSRVLSEISEEIDGPNANNFRIALGGKETNNAEKVAWYLASMTDDQQGVRTAIRGAINDADADANVLERIVYEVVPLVDADEKTEKEYYRVNTAMSRMLTKDLKYLFADPKLASSYLEQVLGFYFFMTVAQNAISVNKGMDADRNEVTKLYFALDTERTGMKRPCATQGFNMLEPAIEEMFVHAGVLEILNTCDAEKQYDYVAIKELCEGDPEAEALIARNVRTVTEACRGLDYNGAVPFKDVEPLDAEPVSAKNEIDYLRRTIRAILYNTQRDKPRGDYSNSFREFCRGPLMLEKNRRRAGIMLNVTEEVLLLLTLLAIGENEELSLTDIFKEFEMRGVFFDVQSKEEVQKIYERRNMLDTKSDSGETQYVKRIL